MELVTNGATLAELPLLALPSGKLLVMKAGVTVELPLLLLLLLLQLSFTVSGKLLEVKAVGPLKTLLLLLPLPVSVVLNGATVAVPFSFTR